MSKNIRSQPVVSRTIDADIDGDYWLKQFQKTLEKEAVQSKKNDQSLFDQINSIMNKKSKYPSVEAAVQEMQERSGLTDYLKRTNNIEKESAVKSIKTAQSVKSNLPTVIQKYPAIKATLENYINSTNGNLPVPAIIDKIKSIHRNDVTDSEDWEDDNLIRFVSKLNLLAKSANTSNYQQYNNLGSYQDTKDDDIDPSNTDAFHSLNPVKL